MKNVKQANYKRTFSELSVELTHKCLLNCIYCSSSADLAKDQNINLDRLQQVIIEAKDKFGVNTISLSGGETFLYPYFSELYDFLTNWDFKVLIYTSGITLNSEGIAIPLSIDFLKDLRPQEGNPELFLNVQGHNKALIEEINKVPGSYEVIEESIDNILSVGLYLGAHLVPFRANYEYIPEIFEYCCNKRFNEICFLRFVPQGRGVDHHLYNTKEEFAGISESIKRILIVVQSEEM